MKIRYIILNLLFVFLFAVNNSFGQISYTEPDYTSGKNVSYTIVPRKAVFNLHELNSKDFSYVIENIQVLDGFGNSIQSIGRKLSPDGKNIVSNIEYDKFGRMYRNYLPYTQDGNTTYVSNSISSQATFYNDNTNDVVTDSKAYAESSYENDPLGRISWQLGVGEDWHNNNKKVNYSYGFNLADSVRKWAYNSALGLYKSTNSYPPGTLTINEVTDEQGNTVIQYIDQSGKIIKKEMEGLITYNVYDEFDRLVYVIPPEAYSKVKNNSWEIDMSNTDIKNLCYEYKYDDKNRMVSKRIPGMDEVLYVYDRLGRPILSQNGVERNSNLWEFVKYDALGRVILSGVYEDSSTQATLQAAFDSENDLYETTISSSYGYTNNALPNIVLGDLNTVNYYDTYDYPLLIGVVNISGFEAASTSNGYAKGLLTVSRSKVLGTSTWLNVELYYDVKGRVIQSVAQNIKSGTDRKYFEYNFSGQLLKSKLFHDNLNDDLNVWKYYEYDHTGRLLSIEQKIEEDNNRTVKLTEMVYNSLGQLETKKIHETGTNSFLQNVDYSYDIRGSLAAINDPNTQNGENDLFGLQIYKTDLTGLGAVTSDTCYNGKIAGIKWQVFGNDSGLKSYGYTYDDKGRLTNADHSEIINSVTYNDRYNVENISYDNNGNIKSLKRNGKVTESGGGTFGNIDDLSYFYTGNKLDKVTDNITSSIAQGKHFKDGLNTGDDFTYDVNGNMTEDKNKGIASISYNILNLPEVITFDDTSVLYYYYTSSGVKLKEVYTSSSSTTTREYVSGMLYINNVRQYLQTETGRVTTSSGFTYVHNINDHQGNIRASFQNNGSGVATLTQENHYYPFGLTMESTYSGTGDNHLYSAKEWKSQNSEDWYDFGWRNYDAALGRWFNIDPLSEQTRALSTYNYCFNDPINFIDPDGLYARYVTEGMHGYDASMDETGNGYWCDSNTGMPLSFWQRNGHNISNVHTRTAIGGSSGGNGNITYTYDWMAHNNGNPGVYRNGFGVIVPFEEVYNNYILPNCTGMNLPSNIKNVSFNDYGVWIEHATTSGSNIKRHSKLGAKTPKYEGYETTLICTFISFDLTQTNKVELNATSELKLHSTNVYVYDGRFKFLPMKHGMMAGQRVKVEVTNMNIFGAQLTLKDISKYTYQKNILGLNVRSYFGDEYSFVLLPGQTKTFEFNRFGNTPMEWAFKLSTDISDVANVQVRFYSEIVPIN